MKRKIYHALKKMNRTWLILFAILFTSISIAGQTYALDEDFYSSNDILFYNPTCPTTSSTSLSGNGIEAEIWNYLKGQGLSDQQAAGVMGNMEAESDFIPTRFQGDSAFNPWDSSSGHGWGLPQWDGGRRYTAPDQGILGALRKTHPELVQYIDIKYDWAKNPSAQSQIPQTDLNALLSFELNYLVQESQSRPVTAQGFGNAGNEWATLKLQTTVDNATVFWHNNFEVSADSAATVLSVRGGFAQQIYNQFAGKVTTTPTTGTTSSSSSSTSGSTTAPTVYLDPGHGGAIPAYVDPQSGLLASDTQVMPETSDNLDVANRVQAALTKDGYNVVLSRTTNDQQVNPRDRANGAQNANASVGVSIYTTSGNVNQVWPQRTGTSRSYNGHTVTFTNDGTAQKSDLFANAIAKARSTTEGTTVTTDPGNTQEAATFSTDPTTGNIPLVSLFSSSVPWVYNEISQDNGAALTDQLKQKYADGIVQGIETALPYTQTDQCGNAISSGNTSGLSQTILSYAWPDYHAAPYTDKKPEYAAAVTKAISQGRYVGGGSYPGVDCGGFVTTLMVDSGYEPRYNSNGKGGNTTYQLQWLQQNWQNLGSATSIDTSTLKPGDVAISSDHTFVFAGTIPGFHSNVASASFSIWRAPMAGHEGLTMSGFTWFRKK